MPPRQPCLPQWPQQNHVTVTQLRPNSEPLLVLVAQAPEIIRTQHSRRASPWRQPRLRTAAGRSACPACAVAAAAAARAAAQRVAARRAGKRLAKEHAARQAAARQQAGRAEHARKVATRRATAQRNLPDLYVSRRQLQEKYAGRAQLFGIQGNWNNVNAARFEQALHRHLASPATLRMRGLYRQDQPVIHNVDPRTGLNVMQKANGDFLSAWRLNNVQLINVLERASL